MNKIIFISIIAIFMVIGCRKKDNQVPVGNKLPYESDSIKLELASIAVPSSTRDIFFFDRSKGFAVTAYGEIYKITNNGFAWLLKYVNEVPNQPFNKILFTDTDRGYIVGGSTYCSEPFCTPPGGVLLKTTDGGSNWLSIFQLPGEEFISITANSSGELFIVSRKANDSGKILKSADFGNTWTTVDSTDYTLNGITFSDNFGFCTGANGKILRSSDNGATWSLAFTFPVFFATDIKFSNGTGFCITNNISVYKTTDNGSSWTQTFFSDNSSFVLNPLTANNCLVFGGGRYLVETGGQCGAVRQTLDSGSHWAEVELVDIIPITLTSFYSLTEGYVVAGSKLIRVTVK